MKFLSNENLMLAYKNARKSRKSKSEVYLWDVNCEENLLKLKKDLEGRTYIHGNYKNIILFDSKKRYINSPIFRDHILHHMIHNILYPVFDKKLINHTYACRKGFGSHKAVKDLKNMCINSGNDIYYLKMDISKYFYSINHDKLKQIIFKHIKNIDLQYAITITIDSYKTNNQFDNLFESDSKYIKNKNKGLPIGSILSQLLANIYLHKLDEFVKHTLKVREYLRYMDDFLLLGNKEQLSIYKKEIINFVYNELDLLINPKKVNFNLASDGIKFVGYKLFNNKIYVGKSTKIKLNKFLDILGKTDLNIFSDNDRKKINSSLQSRFGVFKHSDFKLAYFKKRGDIDIPSWG